MSINRPSRVNSTSRIAGNIGVKASTSGDADGGNVNGLAPGNGYKYHTFTSTGTFSVAAGPLNLTDPNSTTYDHNTKTIGLTNNGASPLAAKNVEFLLVGGGASGWGQAGGGAGGLVVATNFPITGTVTVTIGAGAAYPTSPPVPFPSGGGVDTTLSSPTMTTVTAGGGGAFAWPMVADGGSATGFTPNPTSGKVNASPGPPAAQPTLNPTYSPLPTFNQYGNAGGMGYANDYQWQGGGGGGAGNAGGDSPRSGGGNPVGPGGGGGGNGSQQPDYNAPLIGVPALAPLSAFYAGGGGGNNENYPTYPAPFGNDGGNGGGGDCAAPTARNAADNSGGGGAANFSGWHNPDPQRAGNGGSGIAVIRYSV